MSKSINLNYWKKLFRIDTLIKRKATGTPIEFAQKMNLSRSGLYRYMEDLKSLDAPVKYSKYRQCYYYEQEDFSLKQKIVDL